MAAPIWITPSGSLGVFPSLVYTSKQLEASPGPLTYVLISGSLPIGMSMDMGGFISGTPNLVTSDVTSTFVVRVTDNLGNIQDRTFSMEITGSASPKFTTPGGTILSTEDSTWVSLPITYSNIVSTNLVYIRIIEGILPPGLEINSDGLIRGYAAPPTTTITVAAINTFVTATSSTGLLVCNSTNNFSVGRPIVFSSPVIGGLVADKTYYIKTISNDGISFTISQSPNGPMMPLITESGFMITNLPAVSMGQPINRTYNFVLKLSSALGSDICSYSITVINQNTPQSSDGPGKPINTRIPAIFNTRPPTYYLNNENTYYGYYVLPPYGSSYNTYPPSNLAFMGTFQSDNYFAFKIIGHDFDGNVLKYAYSNLPLGLVGDVDTGWITGTPFLTGEGISQYTFSVSVYKVNNPSILSTTINFSFNVANNIEGIIIWESPEDLGIIYNGTVSTKKVHATSDVPLEYRMISGSLPPNLSLDVNGELVGYVAQQPTTEELPVNTSTEFTFTIQAYSPNYAMITSEKTFTITVYQLFEHPTDVLYITATPSIDDRLLLSTLLDNTEIIPENYLYRLNDMYFGRAKNVTYQHAFGIYASDINEYLIAVTKNHYWRNITLGPINTAIAKDENGTIIYEVVYSEIIDNLVNPDGISIDSRIAWPRPIDLHLGPWYTSITDIFTSYEEVLGQDYYTSLSPGYAYALYPNSLSNMRNRVAQILRQEYDSRLLPLWMTSQQANGSTLGYVPAWVICYTKPGYAEQIKHNIDNNWKDPSGISYTLNLINFELDRFSVYKGSTYNWDNSLIPPAWTSLPSATPPPDPIDSKDFYVLFPRKTILPDRTQ